MRCCASQRLSLVCFLFSLPFSFGIKHKQDLRKEGGEGGADFPLPVGKYAALIRGQTFRENFRFGGCCKEHRKQKQLDQAKSFVEYVLQPIEEAGSTVDLVVSMQPCHLNEELKQVYGADRIKLSEEKVYPGQVLAFHGSWDALSLFFLRGGVMGN
eukprot:TRINITY_DN11743_c0_g1_i1.p1 TRINITY_DN11743_c0_g1~~TRINITY_DN11743_c0_g1_i1.p1  ORF type:complete len:156 (-),score=23.07 TRINITY_DN11743_c0_g1_i1:340-807(-)